MNMACNAGILSCGIDFADGCLIAHIDIVGRGRVGASCVMDGLENYEYDVDTCFKAAVGDALMHPEYVSADELRALGLAKPGGIASALRKAHHSGAESTLLAAWRSDSLAACTPSLKPHPDYQGE